ncbi:hypothetical protein [Brooklawnia sp.]|uniref:hypothetical protein n=1 Tax=Brooklawnia sp. TaxID=2699740 RepID=UPI00311D901A
MSPVNAPEAPGRLGEAIDTLQLRSYLIALDKWLEARRSELGALDVAVQESEHVDELTRDMALSLQLWQSIQTRYRRLLQVWDRGRVQVREREQLSSLVWGRLDDDSWSGTAASGLSLPEACRMSDALIGQLRSRLQLDPAGTQAVARLRDLRASMERLRDQVALEPPPTSGAARARLAQLEERLTTINDKAGRGGDIGGLLGPLEADAATFERDLIVGGVQRRANAQAQQQTAERADAAQRLRADLLARSQQLDEMVDQVVATVGNPPKYAVPDVTALGPVPSADRAALEQYIVRLQQVGQAMDFVARAYSEALRGSQMLANELITLRSEVDQQRLADPQLTALFGVADDLARRSPQPTEALASLMETCRRYVAWLAGLAGARGTVDR